MNHYLSLLIACGAVIFSTRLVISTISHLFLRKKPQTNFMERFTGNESAFNLHYELHSYTPCFVDLKALDFPVTWSEEKVDLIRAPCYKDGSLTFSCGVPISRCTLINKDRQTP